MTMSKPLNQKNSSNNLVVVLGPTATGKTRFAAELASRIHGEIISADSRQVYRRMNLGTGKDYEDYNVEGMRVPSHLIDILEPGCKYNVFEFQRDFTKVFRDITDREKIPVLCGGTGLYIEAVTKGYKLINVPQNSNLRMELAGKTLKELEKILSTYKKLHNQTDTDTVERAIRAIEIEEYYHNHPTEDQSVPEINPIYLGIQCERFIRRKRITQRLHSRLKDGMVDEVRALLAEGIHADDLIYYGLEYKYITRYLLGEMDYSTMIERLNTAIHQFAKRQMTWFRKMEREGILIRWIDAELPMDEKLKLAFQYLRLNSDNKM
jgi:tRNA dimethylallyltransferase